MKQILFILCIASILSCNDKPSSENGNNETLPINQTSLDIYDLKGKVRTMRTVNYDSIDIDADGVATILNEAEGYASLYTFDKHGMSTEDLMLQKGIVIKKTSYSYLANRDCDVKVEVPKEANSPIWQTTHNGKKIFTDDYTYTTTLYPTELLLGIDIDALHDTTTVVVVQKGDIRNNTRASYRGGLRDSSINNSKTIKEGDTIIRKSTYQYYAAGNVTTTEYTNTTIILERDSMGNAVKQLTTQKDDDKTRTYILISKYEYYN